MQAEAMILQVSSRETERSTSTVAVKNDKQGERERGREKKGNRDGKVSKEAENLCNNRETSDSPSRKKTGKGSKGRGESEKSAGVVSQQQRDELLPSSRLASRR